MRERKRERERERDRETERQRDRETERQREKFWGEAYILVDNTLYFFK